MPSRRSAPRRGPWPFRPDRGVQVTKRSQPEMAAGVYWKDIPSIFKSRRRYQGCSYHSYPRFVLWIGLTRSAYTTYRPYRFIWEDLIGFNFLFPSGPPYTLSHWRRGCEGRAQAQRFRMDARYEPWTKGRNCWYSCTDTCTGRAAQPCFAWVVEG